MVMIKVTQVSRVPRASRMGVAQAKAKLSGVLRNIEQAPVVIHSRGRDVGALIDMNTYERIVAANDTGIRPGGQAFVAQVERLKRRYGPGVKDFAPAPAVIAPIDPFAAERRGS